MIAQQFKQYADKVAADGSVTTIIRYPHPLTAGGLIVISTAAGEQWLRLLSRVQRHAPGSHTIHCLRPHEMGLLAQPGIFAPPLSVNEFPHLLPWLRHRGLLLHGVDVRGHLPASPDARPLLAAHVEACTDTLRRYGIMPYLMNRQYGTLIQMLALEMKHLMATALLIHDEWDVTLDTITKRFANYYPDPHLEDSRRELQALTATPAGAVGEREIAYKAVWLFEQFLARIPA